MQTPGTMRAVAVFLAVSGALLLWLNQWSFRTRGSIFPFVILIAPMTLVIGILGILEPRAITPGDGSDEPTPRSVGRAAFIAFISGIVLTILVARHYWR